MIEYDLPAYLAPTSKPKATMNTTTAPTKQDYNNLKAALLDLGSAKYEGIRSELIGDYGYDAFRKLQNEIFKEIGTIQFEKSHTMKTQQTEHEQFIQTIADGPTRRRNQTATPAQASGNCRTSHSPLPWHCPRPPIGPSQPIILANNGLPVAGLSACQSREQEEANAAFIVRACNEYEQLVKDVAFWKAHAVKLDELLGRNKAHAQRLADALENPDVVSLHDIASEALAQWKESPADADALEALDQLEQLEGSE